MLDKAHRLPQLEILNTGGPTRTIMVAYSLTGRAQIIALLEHRINQEGSKHGWVTIQLPLYRDGQKYLL